MKVDEHRSEGRFLLWNLSSSRIQSRISHLALCSLVKKPSTQAFYRSTCGLSLYLLHSSIGLEIDGFDHAPPFDNVGSKHHLGGFLIRVGGFKAELLETRGHFRILQNPVDRRIHRRDNLVRRFGGQEKSGPCRCDEARVAALAVSRNVGQDGHALLAG